MFDRLKRLLTGTLRRQLIAGMALIVALMMSLFVWDLTRRQHIVMLEQQSVQAVALARSVAASAAVWVASRDFSGLQEIVEGLARYPDLRHAIVLDVRGQVLAHSDPARQGLYLTDLPRTAEPTILQRTPSLVDVASPVMLGGNQIGWVRIGLAHGSLDANLAQVARGGLFYALIAIALSILFAALAGRYLTRRLYAIQRVADAVQAGKSGSRAVVSGDDEAAQLARQFNGMLDSLGQREDALRESEERFRTLIEWSPEPLAVYRDGILIYVNPAAMNMMGAKSAQDLIGKPVLNLIHPDFRQIVLARMKSASGHGGATPMMEEKFLKLDGTEIDVEVQSTPIVYDGEPAVQVAMRDITERKRAEESLRTLSRAIEQSPVSIVITNPDGNIHYVNPKFEAATGYRRAEVIGRNPRLLNSGEKSPAEYRDMWATLLAGGTWQGEFHNRRKDGTLFWELASISPVFNEKGDLIHFVAVKEDITERRQVETERKNLNRDFVTFLENTSDFIYFKDADSRFRFCSQTLADITGHPSWRDMTGKHDREVFPADVARIYIEEEASIFRDGIPLLGKTDPYYDAEGRPGWVSTSKWPIFDDAGKVTGIFGINRDVTQTMRAEIDLRIAATAFESQEGMFITDAKKAIVRVNRAFTEITGYTEEDAIGQTPKLLSSGHHDAAFYKAMQDSIAYTGGVAGRNLEPAQERRDVSRMADHHRREGCSGRGHALRIDAHRHHLAQDSGRRDQDAGLL